VKYQTGIDAIRAIAIIAVLGYHGEMPGFGGGFVGVDVFFVISGYLMTSRILHDVQESNFSFVNYFERRLRRLIPALLLLVLAVLVVGSIVMFPDDLMAMASDVPWVLLFGANIVYWKTHDYFIAPPETLWLLHTWSLGVEEQAYVALPFLLVLVSRGPIMIKKIVLVSLIVMSFALVLVFGTTSPVATFYLLPTRFWEIACGALLAVLLGNRTPLRPPRSAELNLRIKLLVGWVYP
jgi:peptidoglycan/LPS O-acetylase OafA/YrhL